MRELLFGLSAFVVLTVTSAQYGIFSLFQSNFYLRKWRWVGQVLCFFVGLSGACPRQSSTEHHFKKNLKSLSCAPAKSYLMEKGKLAGLDIGLSQRLPLSAPAVHCPIYKNKLCLNVLVYILGGQSGNSSDFSAAGTT